MRWTSKLPLPGVLFALIALSLAWAGHRRYFETPVYDDGDAAVNALQIDNAKHVSELYGNYSRFEFNHPGPAFWYVYATGEYLFHDWSGISPSPKGAHLLASMLLQVFFFVLGLAILQSHLRIPAWPFAASLAAALYLGPLEEPFMSVWPPHVILMPFFCFLAASISVATGRTRHIIPLLVVGGLLVHGHVAQSLFVGALGGLSLVLCFAAARRESGLGLRALLAAHRRILLIGTGIIGVFLFPLILDLVLHGRESNVAGIVGFYYVHLSERETLLKSLLYFLSFATRTPDQHELLSALGPQTTAFFQDHSLTIALSVAMLLVAPACAVAFWRKQRLTEARFYGTASVFLWGAVVLGIFWARSQIGGIENFNGYFFYSLYCFGLVLALAPLVALIPRPAAPAVGALAGAAAAIAFAVLFREATIGDSERAIDLRSAVAEGLRRDEGDRPRFLVFEHASWPVVAGLALALQKAGTAFYVSPWWGFMFGARHEETRLQAPVDEHADVWWITRKAEGGLPLNRDLSLYTTPAPIRPEGDLIDFTPGKNGFRYVVTGVTVGNIDYAVTNLPHVLFLFAPVLATKDVQINFDALDPLKKLAAEVYFDGVNLGTVSALERGEPRVTVPRDLWNSKPTARLELRFPSEVRPVHHMERPRYENWPGWWLWGIRFGPG